MEATICKEGSVSLSHVFTMALQGMRSEVHHVPRHLEVVTGFRLCEPTLAVMSGVEFLLE